MKERYVANWREVIEEIKIQDVSRLANIFPEFCKKNKKGLRYIFFCFIHNEKTPSLRYFYPQNLFTCLGCGFSGTIIDYYQHKKKTTFHQAVIDLARIYKIKLIWQNKTPEK